MSFQVTTVSAAPDVTHNPAASAFYLPGDLVAIQLLGEQNEGLLSLSEYADYFSYMRLLTDQPFWADGQSGFGNPLNTYFTVQELEQRGADVILLNDQRYPAHTKTDQRSASTLPDFAGKLKAGVDAHHTSNTEIWAKLDCFSEYGADGLQKHVDIAKKIGASGIVVDHAPATTLASLKTTLPVSFVQRSDSTPTDAAYLVQY